jgi:hypothetical protein
VARGGHRWWLLAVAGVLWLWTVFSHGLGTDIASGLFSAAQKAGDLDESGASAGVARLELWMAVAFLAFFVLAAARMAWRSRGLPDGELRSRALTWLIWGVFTHLVWKCLIIFGTELIHFAQYGVVAALLCAGIDRGRRPQLAFAIACVGGMLDEAWQHWGIAYWIDGYLRHGLDWSDFILNATGACGGVLAVTTGSRGGREMLTSDRTTFVFVGVLAALFLPLVLLADRVTLAELFGWYHYHPYWHELADGKPVHWMTPIDGIPLFLASFLFLGLLVGPRRRLVTQGAALALLVLVSVSIQPPTRRAPRPLHEPVPSLRAQRVDDGSVLVDGRLDEPVWGRAERVGPFVHHVSGSDTLPLDDGTRLPFAPTHARVVWDAEAVYFAFEADDDDVWARDVERDERTLPGDEVVEVFLDPDGDEITYYEFEFSPLNVQYDLFNYTLGPPTDHNPWAPFIGLADWDAHGLRSAVHVRGTLDVPEDFETASAIDEDEGWTVEVAIPWDVFRTTTTPSERTWVKLPPTPGQRWRLGLYRVERPRLSPVDGTPMDRRQAGDYQQLQAWSHTLLDSFHVPARFGVMEFVDER